MAGATLWIFVGLVVLAAVEVVQSIATWIKDRKTCNICGKPNFVVRGSKLRKYYTCANDHEKCYVTLRGLLYMIDVD